MSARLFEVGERVIVLWGDVGPCEEVITAADYVKGSWCYQFASMPKMVPDKAWAPQRIVRKRPPLGDSFDTLMTNLKNPLRIEA